MTQTNEKHGWDGNVYRDADGAVWLTAEGMEAECGVNRATVRRWAKAHPSSRRPGAPRCPFFSAPRRLRSKLVKHRTAPRSLGFRGKVRVFLVADVRKAISARDDANWDGEIYSDGSGDWITAKGAKAKYGLPSTSLRRAVTQSQLVWRQTEMGQPKVRVFLVSEIEALHARRQTEKAGTDHRDDDGGLWLTAKQIADRFGVSLSFVDYWSQKPTSDGFALRTKRLDNGPAAARKGPRPMLYSLTDVEKIIRGERSRERGRSAFVGNGRYTEARRKTLRRDAQRVVCEILADGPLPPTEVIRRAAEHGIRRKIVEEVKKRAKVVAEQNGKHSWVWRLRGWKPKPATSASSHLDLTAIETVTIEQASKVMVKAQIAEVVSGEQNSGEVVKPLTVTVAAKIAQTDPGTISREVSAGRLKSNGQSGRGRRISTNDLIAWLISRKGIDLHEKAWQAEYEATRRKLGVSD